MTNQSTDKRVKARHFYISSIMMEYQKLVRNVENAQKTVPAYISGAIADFDAQPYTCIHAVTQDAVI